jgi:hypothetical protein
MDEAIEYLNQHGTEAAQIQLFEVWVSGAAVRVELHDRGEDADVLRYSALAYSPEVPEADRRVNEKGFSLGNPDTTVRGALMNLHWTVFESTSRP